MYWGSWPRSGNGSINEYKLLISYQHLSGAAELSKARQGDSLITQKTLDEDWLKEGFDCKIRHRPTLPRFTAVPLALAGLTSLFGMGRGRHRRYRHLNIFNVGISVVCFRLSVFWPLGIWSLATDYCQLNSTMTYYWKKYLFFPES